MPSLTVKLMILTLVAHSLSSFGQGITSRYSKEHSFDKVKIAVAEVEKEARENNRPPEKMNYALIKIDSQNAVVSKEETIARDRIVESWLSDLDQDKNFEISFHAVSSGSGSYGTLCFFEHNNGELVRHHIPELNSRLKKFYMGHDKFKVSQRVIERKFPAYHETDPNCCPTGGTVKIEYEFVNNQIRSKDEALIEKR